MYRKILLAADDAAESLVALREGALLAQAYGAEVFLLVVMPDSAAFRMADSIYAAPRSDPDTDLLEKGLERLTRLGVSCSGAVRIGEPAQLIGASAAEFCADLVVVGHRRRSLLDRWWSGESGAYLVDYVKCSVLIARDCVSDAEFERHLEASSARTAQPTFA